MPNMASVDLCHADLGLAVVPCPDEVLTQLQKVGVATLFQILDRPGFQRLRAEYDTWRKQQVT